jgi:hypothetical protein
VQVAIALFPRLTDPQPPFDAGHPSKVAAAVMDRVGEYTKVRP